jgi:glycosyltransferase involved in cell wall biosynthesis
MLPGCLESLGFADEIVVVLDRTDDGSAAFAAAAAHRLIEGAWPIEGDRRNTGIDACTGDWILEVDADERVPPALAAEIRRTIATAPAGHFLIPFDNYIGQRLVRHGWGAAWGVRETVRLFARGCKRWGPQHVHPTLELYGPKGRLSAAMVHYVDRDISDMLARLDRYTTARAADLRVRGGGGGFAKNLARMPARFWKCFVARGGWREGRWGFLLALMAALYPILSHLKATLEPAPAEEVYDPGRAPGRADDAPPDRSRPDGPG